MNITVDIFYNVYSHGFYSIALAPADAQPTETEGDYKMSNKIYDYNLLTMPLHYLS